MNTPNKLTILRFIMTPVFLALMLIDFRHNLLAALIVFTAASITDLYDGKIAREQNLITNFGKFMDPIADKMLTTTAFLAFIHLKMGYGVVWVTFIILAREFIVTSVRLVAADNGKVVAANYWGKLKTVAQIFAIITTITFEYIIIELINNSKLLPDSFVTPLKVIYSVLLWICAVLTLIAGVTYLVQNKQFIDTKK